MDNLYSEKKIVDATCLDMNLNMSILEIMRVVEETTFNHSHIMGLDHEDMLEKSNAFWIVNKIKLAIINPEIKGYDTIRISTWTQPPGLLRFDRDSMIKRGNKIMVKAKSEWCCLDATTRRPRKSSTIYYPELDMVKTDSNNLTYTNLKLDVLDSDYVYTHIVRSTDLDVNNHTNNLKYNYIAMNAFSAEELRQLNIKEYEIYFVSESHEGDEIKVYKKTQQNTHYIEGQARDKTIFRVVLKCKR